MGDLSKFFNSTQSTKSVKKTAQNQTSRKRKQANSTPSNPAKMAKVDISLIEDFKTPKIKNADPIDSIDTIMMNSDDDTPQIVAPPKISLVKPPPELINKRKSVIAPKPSYKIPENLRDIQKHGQCKPSGGAKVIGTKMMKKKQNPPVGPLTGQTIVITGVITTIEREELSEMLRSYGARVTGSVSNRTTCLIHGQKLEDGRHYTEGRKYKSAKELGKKIIDEKELNDLLSHLLGKNLGEPNTENMNPDVDSNKESIPEAIIPAQPTIQVGTEMWTDKYRPINLKEIVGNTQAVEKLVNWLRD